MNTFDKIDMLLKQQKKKQIQLTDFLGLNKNAYSDWKIGRTSSYTKHLSQIAEFFDVSVDYLLGKEDQKIPLGPIVEREEDMLWAKICRLSDANRHKIDGYVTALLDEQEREEIAKSKNA